MITAAGAESVIFTVFNQNIAKYILLGWLTVTLIILLLAILLDWDVDKTMIGVFSVALLVSMPAGALNSRADSSYKDGRLAAIKNNYGIKVVQVLDKDKNSNRINKEGIMFQGEDKDGKQMLCHSQDKKVSPTEIRMKLYCGNNEVAKVKKANK